MYSIIFRLYEIRYIIVNVEERDMGRIENANGKKAKKKVIKRASKLE